MEINSIYGEATLETLVNLNEKLGLGFVIEDGVITNIVTD